MKENGRICNVLNELTVEEFLEVYSERMQERMSELGYYVKDGFICIDQEENMRKRTKILLNVLKFILAVLLFIAALAFIVAWAALGQEET